MSYGKKYIIFVRLSLVTPLYCCDKTLLSRQQECRDKVYYVEVSIQREISCRANAYNATS